MKSFDPIKETDSTTYGNVIEFEMIKVFYNSMGI